MSNKRTFIQVKGVQKVKNGLMKLGMTPRKSRNEINKALRPAANKLARGMKVAYKNKFKSKNPGRRYNPKTKKYVYGTRIADTIGITAARRSKQPGLFVGPMVKKINPHYWRKGASKNLPAMQIKGYKNRSGELVKYPNVFKATAERMGNQISKQAQKDIERLLDKMIKKAGF